MAKVSNTPGRTRLINIFDVALLQKDEDIQEVREFVWVDLPGYGYASVSKGQRLEFAKFIKKYLENRKNLMCLFVLLDSRLKPQKIDMEFMQWLGKKGIPFVMCFTKQDKLSKSEAAKNLANYQKEMKQIWEELPPIFLTSSTNKKGQDEVLQFVADTNKLF